MGRYPTTQELAIICVLTPVFSIGAIVAPYTWMRVVAVVLLSASVLSNSVGWWAASRLLEIVWEDETDER